MLTLLPLLATFPTSVLCAPSLQAQSGPVHLPLRQSRHNPRGRRLDLQPRQDPAIHDVEAWSDSRASWYYITIEVGTPPQPVDVHVDTGSARLLIVSNNCSPGECDLSTPFNEDYSTTYASKGEELEARFAGHSAYTGMWVSDTMSLGHWTLYEYEFGLINSTSNDSDAPSLMGLAWKDPDGKVSSPTYMWATDGTWRDPQFGVYLARPGITEADEYVNGSLLTFGGVASDAVDGEINYVKSSVKNDWYVDIDKVTIGGQQVALDGTQIGAVDTGTTGIFVPDAILDEIFSHVDGAEPTEAGRGGYTFPCDAPNLNFTLTIGGIDYPLYWADMIWRSSGNTCYSSLYPNGRLTENLRGNKWILGDAFLKNVYTAFRYKPHGIGFGHLKPQYNWQANLVPGPQANIEAPKGGEGAAAGGGSGNHSAPTGDGARSRLSPSRVLNSVPTSTSSGGRRLRAAGLGMLFIVLALMA